MLINMHDMSRYEQYLGFHAFSTIPIFVLYIFFRSVTVGLDNCLFRVKYSIYLNGVPFLLVVIYERNALRGCFSIHF